MDCNVPRGEWSPYVGGSVQIVVRVDRMKSGLLKLNETDRTKVKVINNFGGALNPKQQTRGEIQIEKRDDGKMLLTGTIQLTSKEPSTFQKIVLNKTVVPVRTIKEELKHEYDPKGFLPRDPEEVYKEVLEKSSKPVDSKK
jgi:hypothetical protein